jgi:hypothetical protein
MKTTKFKYRPQFVEAVQVTRENMNEVMVWCEGEIRGGPTNQHIWVHVYRARTKRQRMAFIGDWVIFTGRVWKIYTAEAFKGVFEDASLDSPEPGLQILSSMQDMTPMYEEIREAISSGQMHLIAPALLTEPERIQGAIAAFKAAGISTDGAAYADQRAPEHHTDVFTETDAAGENRVVVLDDGFHKAVVFDKE